MFTGFGQKFTLFGVEIICCEGLYLYIYIYMYLCVSIFIDMYLCVSIYLFMFFMFYSLVECLQDLDKSLRSLGADFR